MLASDRSLEELDALASDRSLIVLDALEVRLCRCVASFENESIDQRQVRRKATHGKLVSFSSPRGNVWGRWTKKSTIFIFPRHVFEAKKKKPRKSPIGLVLHHPGIEPGSHPWQGCILPLDQ